MKVRLVGTARLPPSARKPAALAAACLKTLKSEGAARAGEINIIFLDRGRMRALNRRFLKSGRDTDVIAFGYPPPPKALRGAAEDPFGDIFISAHRARIQAKRMGHGVLTEARELIIHGTLHLLGYEDKTPGRRALMFRKQGLLLGSS